MSISPSAIINLQDDEDAQVKHVTLTYKHLKKLQEASWSVPIALDEWRFVLTSKVSREELPRPPVGPASSSQSHSQDAATDQTPTGRLQKEPERYNLELVKDYGIHDYDYERADLKLPANLADIRKALTVERNDTPSIEAYHRYCQSIQGRLVESDIGELCREFLGVSRYDGIHSYTQITWSDFGGILPPGQKSLTPDMSCGLSSLSSDVPSWVIRHIPGFVRGRSMISVNGIVEYKNSHKGSNYVARVQNRAAAGLAVIDWHRFSAVDPGQGPMPHQAYVGSICFNGNTIEASIHWLEPAPSNSGRESNVHCFRVATGHPFAATYEEFRDVQKTFRNFLDWLRGLRHERLERIKAISEEPANVPPPPNRSEQS